MSVTRRDFLMRVGQLGGYSAAFTFMQHLGLLPAMGVTHEIATLRKVPGHGTSVVILGGGIAGLVSAYELGKLGYRCTLLEARRRVGGRNWTVRGGTTVEFTDGFTQTCNWEGQLPELRPRPSSLDPHHHAGLLPGVRYSARSRGQHLAQHTLAGRMT